MSNTNENTPKRNRIKAVEHGVDVTLDPAFVITHAAYMPDGNQIVKSEMTIGQLIEGIALAHINAKMPHLAGKCRIARIEFRNGRFLVRFADTVEDLAS